MTKLKNELIFILIALVLITLGYWYFKVNNALETPGITINMSPVTVIKEIRAMNRLETASYTIEKVIDAGTSGNTFQEFLYGDRILLIAHGESIAGFDLSTLSDNSISVDGSTVRLTLPPPQILITKLDSDQTRVYDRKSGILTKGNKDLESKARLAAENAIQVAACKGNILDHASQNARKQLTALLKSLGFVTVIIDIPQGSC